MEQNFLETTRKQFTYYQLLGEKTFAQLSDEELFWRPDDEANSIAIIVKHLWGNMLSRWTDFLSSDGEKAWRDREGEFAADIQSREELMEKWQEGWQCLFEALESIYEEDFETVIYIRNMGHTVVEAVLRQLAHYAYHIGQIVWMGRMIKGKEWQSLSIPRGGSATFNQKRFAQPKQRKHFTDDLQGE